MNPYKVLQVDSEAEPEVIDAAYRRLAAKYHPDRDPSPSATARMEAINAGYEILKDSDRREEYDRARAEGRKQQRREGEAPQTPKSKSARKERHEEGEPPTHRRTEEDVIAAKAASNEQIKNLILGGVVIALVFAFPVVFVPLGALWAAWSAAKKYPRGSRSAACLRTLASIAPSW